MSEFKDDPTIYMGFTTLHPELLQNLIRHRDQFFSCQRVVLGNMEPDRQVSEAMLPAGKPIDVIMVQTTHNPFTMPITDAERAEQTEILELMAEAATDIGLPVGLRDHVLYDTLALGDAYTPPQDREKLPLGKRHADEAKILAFLESEPVRSYSRTNRIEYFIGTRPLYR